MDRSGSSPEERATCQLKVTVGKHGRVCHFNPTAVVYACAWGWDHKAQNKEYGLTIACLQHCIFVWFQMIFFYFPNRISLNKFEIDQAITKLEEALKLAPDLETEIEAAKRRLAEHLVSESFVHPTGFRPHFGWNRADVFHRQMGCAAFGFGT